MKAEISSTKAVSDDGTVQLTMTIPASLVVAKKEEATEHLIAELEVPGFRKGKAPREMAQKHIDSQKIYEHTLQHLLPEAYLATVEEHKIKPILNPRFELLSAKDGQDWQVRAITCEAPEVLLGDYKKAVAGTLRTSSLWKPGENKDQNPPAGGPSREEKEQQVIKTLLETTKTKIPKLLIDEEVNHRLSKLVEELQKLGLTIEQYLASTKKTAADLRAQYEKDAQGAIKLEMALNKIADEEKVAVDEKEVDQMIAASGDKKTQEALQSPSQKQLIKSVLLRRHALDRLVGLV